jgi:carboxypeptidase family protein
MHLPRLPRKPLAIGSAGLLSLVLLGAGSALAARAASSSPASHRAVADAAGPRLTANTNAACNAPRPKGYARCLAIVRTPSDRQITPDDSGPPSGALGPADIQSAYKLPLGGGQTVAIVDAYDDPNAESDLAVFRSKYGLPPCTTASGCFSKVNQDGQPSPLPQPSGTTGWSLEESLDLEAVSSACPGCNIILVEANSDSNSDLYTAENAAVTLGAKFVSNSWASCEYSGETSDEQSYFNHPGVAITAASGDWGYDNQGFPGGGCNTPSFPAASQYVTSVGGTTLTKDTSVSRGWDESVWGTSPTEGTGSGCSQYEPQPAFQGNIPALDAACRSNRATSDIAADADPASGLAVYDSNPGDCNGPCDWIQVGGTSLATPLIASMYALAGTPAANSYPVTYPYQDQNQSGDLFDITTGSNGSCGNALCQAGAGWDGPAGLGTPDGVKALQGAPQGTITGQVTDASTGKPVAGAKVTASPGSYGTITGSNGNYDLTLPAGTYTLTAADYGYQTETQTGVQVTAGQTLTENIALTAEPSGTLSGTVTDGSGHGWPLHTQITIPGYPSGSIWTSPDTGKYSVTLPQGSYTLTASTDYPGYQQKQLQVTVGGNTTQNITLDADLTACTAPGYGWNGLTEAFTGWSAATPEAGWTVSGTHAGWRFDNPGNRPPPQQLPIPGPVQVLTGGDDNFAIADSGTARGPMDTTLTSPAVNLSRQTRPELSFDTGYYAASRQSAAVELSVDGGQHWATVWQRSATDAVGHVSIPVPAAAGQPDVQVRFRYTGTGWYWAVDNVFLGTHACVAQPGGLLLGVVTGQATGNPVDGAQVTTASTQAPAWPAGTAQATSDPALPGGFYWLFTPAGAQQVTATAAGYSAATATVDIPDGSIARRDFVLTARGS